MFVLKLKNLFYLLCFCNENNFNNENNNDKHDNFSLKKFSSKIISRINSLIFPVVLHILSFSKINLQHHLGRIKMNFLYMRRNVKLQWKKRKEKTSTRAKAVFTELTRMKGSEKNIQKKRRCEMCYRCALVLFVWLFF